MGYFSLGEKVSLENDSWRVVEGLSRQYNSCVRNKIHSDQSQTLISMNQKTLSGLRTFFLCTWFTILLFSFSKPFSFAAAGNQHEIIKLENWEYRLGDLPKDIKGNYILNSTTNSGWTNSHRVSILPIDSKSVVWFRTRLSSVNIFAPAIFVSRAQDLMTVFLDDKLIFTNMVFIKDSGDISDLGIRWSLIKLPENYPGKYVYFRFYSEGNYIGMSSTVSLGNADTFISKMVQENIDDIIIGAVIMLTGIGMMIIMVFIRARFYLGLTIFCISTGLVICLNNPYINLLFDNVTLLNYLNYLSLYFMAMLFMVVEALVIDKYKKIIRLCWQIHLAYIIIAVLLSLFPLITLQDMEDPFFIILLLLSNFSLYMLFKSASRERIESLILLVGTIIFSGFGTAEILLYYSNYYSDNWYTNTYVMHYGAFIYNIFLVILVSYRYWNQVQQKQNAQKIIVEQQQAALEAVQREKRLQEKYTHQLLQSQDNERKKIAMELHDAIGQELLIIKNTVLLSLKQGHSQDNEGKINKYMNDISETVSGVIENVRSLARNLHPYQIHSLGLSGALEAIIKRVACTTNIRFTYNIDNIDNLFERETEVHIYRIIQEVINNILKHSDADESVINIIKEEKKVNIFITDDGKGFPINPYLYNKSYKPTGIGLSGISERVNIIGGELNFNSEPGDGLTINIKIPV